MPLSRTLDSPKLRFGRILGKLFRKTTYNENRAAKRRASSDEPRIGLTYFGGSDGKYSIKTAPKTQFSAIKGF